MIDPSRPDDSSGLAQDAVTETFRSERAAVLATLIRQVRDLDLAEDALQDAFESATEAWKRDGVPANPAAWITVVARRHLIDRLRRNQSMARRVEQLAAQARMDAQVNTTEDEAGGISDDRLRLMFTCCHPAIDVSAQVALTLRTLGGLTTSEIAGAFLVKDPAMAKRIVRAKRTIRDGRIPFGVPSEAELPNRLVSVLRVIYLIFNEGYLATEGADLMRGSLCEEAIRLGGLVSGLLPQESEASGLVALMLFHDSRRNARVDSAGRFVPFDRQDRSLWDTTQIVRGLDLLSRALRTKQPGPYQLQAAITALQMRASDLSAAEWQQIVDLYRALNDVAPSPVVELNQVVAIGFTDGARTALELLEPLLRVPALQLYQPLHAAHADLLVRTGDLESAARAFERAIQLTKNKVERQELVRRRLTLAENGSPSDFDVNRGAPIEDS